MKIETKAKDNPRVIAIQKIYGKFYNKEEDLVIGKHRFKKFIKDVVNGTIERDEIISEEINNISIYRWIYFFFEEFESTNFYNFLLIL